MENIDEKFRSFFDQFDFDPCSVMIGEYGPALQTVAIVLFVLFFNFLLKKLLLRLRTRFNERDSVWAWSFVAALPKPLNCYVWYVAAICSIDNIASGLTGFHLTNISLFLVVGGIVAFCWFLLRWNHKVMHTMIERSQSHLIPFDPGKIDLIGKIISIAIIFVTLFMLMDQMGYNMQTLITFGGIGGLAIAFASQQLISSFFGGVLIYMTRPFTIGERISLPSQKIEGYIEEIGWYTTRIRNLEKQPIYLPNSIFTQSVVITPSRMSHDRFHYTLGLRYQDVDRVPAVVDAIRKMLIAHQHVDQHLAIDVCFTNFGISSLEIDVSCFVPIVYKTDFKKIRQDLLLKIYEAITKVEAQLATNSYAIEFQNSLNLHNTALFSQVKI